MTDRGKRVGVIGLGAMGFGMASSLMRAGFEVAGFDPSPAAQDRARAAGIAVQGRPEAVFDASDTVVLSLPTAQHVETVVTDAVAAGHLSAGTPKLIIDSSTSEAAVSRRLASSLQDAGHGFLDAPVSGGPSGAMNGQLSVMLGGDEAWVEQALPVLEAMASKILHVGASGAGNVAKLVNNMLVAAHMLTTAEGLRLAEAAGLGAGDALRVINAATGRSALSEVHFPNWVLSGSFDSGFSTGLMRKDLRLAREMAAGLDCGLPVADLVADLWSEDRSGLRDADDFMLMGDPQRNPKETF